MFNYNRKIQPSAYPLIKGDFVGVYGTLRKDQSNNINTGLGDPALATYIGQTTVSGFLYALGGYPGLVNEHLRGEPPSEVVVDIYMLKDENLGRRLDTLEGYYHARPSSANNFYKRAIVMDEKHDLYMHVYYYEGDVSKRPLIESGDYVEYITPQLTKEQSCAV